MIKYKQDQFEKTKTIPHYIILICIFVTSL